MEIDDVNILSLKSIMPPKLLLNELKSSEKNREFIKKSRGEIENILSHKDKRKLIIAGPCSIHDVKSAKEYGGFIKKMRKKYGNKLMIVMRVYFEKPRTTIGWKGLINDPNLNDTFDIDKGLRLGRELLLELAKMEVPTACEFLDTFTPQYISDLISWGSIGARTVESQNHRQLVSGLSMPIGFKNTTGGCIDSAIEGMKAGNASHCFYGIDKNGSASIVTTKGNKNLHLILRGSKNGPNYYKHIVDDILYDTDEPPTNPNPNPNILIDCSHGNSLKDYRRQCEPWRYFINNFLNNDNMIGMMLESNLCEGKQSINDVPLKYGLSITDSCIGLLETEVLLRELYEKL